MTENIVAETAERIFSDLADAQNINTAGAARAVQGEAVATQQPPVDGLGRRAADRAAQGKESRPSNPRRTPLRGPPHTPPERPLLH